MKALIRIAGIALLLTSVVDSGAGARDVDRDDRANARARFDPGAARSFDSRWDLETYGPVAVRDTTVLASYSFNPNGVCDSEGWVGVDLMAQVGDYFHVDDFAGLGGGLVPLEGFSESLLVQELMNPGLRKVFDELVSYHKGAEFYITPHQLPARPFLDYQIAALKSEAKLQIVGRVHKGQAELPPPNDIILEPDDQLVVIAGEKQDFLTFQKQFLSQA